MVFTKRLREGIRRGEITCSVRIWMSPRVRVGARYRMEEGEIEVDSIEPIGFPDITPAKSVQPWMRTGGLRQPPMQTRNTIFTMTMLFVIILSRASESSVETWGQERVKKCRFWISTELAFKNLSFRTRIGDVCDVGIHFGSPEKFLGSISSQVPVPGFPTGRTIRSVRGRFPQMNWRKSQWDPKQMCNRPLRHSTPSARCCGRIRPRSRRTPGRCS
jgi:hypothetical protein